MDLSASIRQSNSRCWCTPSLVGTPCFTPSLPPKSNVLATPLIARGSHYLVPHQESGAPGRMGGTPLPGRILSTLFLTNPKRQAGLRVRAGWVLTPCSSVRTRTKHLRYHVPVSLSISISSSICLGVLILFTCKAQQRAKC